jgi:Ca2+-transporting ATPase
LNTRVREFDGIIVNALVKDTAQLGHADKQVEADRYPHAASATSTAEALGVDPKPGLKSTEIVERRARCGANTLQSIRPRAAWRILLEQFASLVIALLAFAAIVALATGDVVDAMAILAVLVLNALIGFATEWQAGRALDALRRQARSTARVRRDGHEITVALGELVPGDIVILNAGDRVPADARLIESASLRAEESALTGESTTVDKSPQPVPFDALLAERSSMLYLGTSIAGGRAVAIITATGAQTELGRIGKLVASAPDESTPLKRKLDQLSRRLVYIVLIVGVLVVLAGWLRGDNLWLMIEVGISLAVAAVPEALPAVTTLILALGVLRMARQRAIVRRLASVETLGSATIICSDKTGTLTENRMTAREFYLSDGRKAEFNGKPHSLAGDDLLARAGRVGVLCSEASFNPNAVEGARALGDPTETALLVAADEMGLDVSALRANYPKVVEIPFDAATKRMITAHHEPDGDYLGTLKGAPAVVLKDSTSYVGRNGELRSLDDEVRAQFLEVNNEMAGRALRVLALAEKRSEDIEIRMEPGSDFASQSNPEIESGYTFLGFVGMIDPPRTEVAEAIEKARQAGIRVVMLTGDQINTARAIARELRLSGDAEPKALHARDLQRADSGRIAELVRATDVFARVSPEDKLRIVEALRDAGEVVAVTGDGVNDAPALKRADIGVAMGLRGTEVAKEAAAVVLADDNFATILKAIEGGRTIYANIIKFIHLMFSKNLGVVLAIFVAIISGLPLPLLPLQILWINLVTDVFPALALALEPAAPGVMQRRPRSPNASLLARPFFLLIIWQGAMLAAIIVGAYTWALEVYGEGAHARTVALMALVGVQIGHMFNCRSRTRSAFAGLSRSPFVWGAAFIVIGLQLAAVYVTPLARVLNTTRLTPTDWLIAAGAVIAPIIFVEATKSLARWKRPPSRALSPEFQPLPLRMDGMSVKSSKREKSPLNRGQSVMQLVKAGVLYFALVFGAGLVLGPIRELWAVPRFGQRIAELIEAPLMLIAVVFAARWTVRRFRVSLETTTSLGIGLTALGFLLAAELLVVLGLRSLSVAEYIKSRDPVSGIVYLLMLGVFALMPWLVSLWVVDSAANGTRRPIKVEQNGSAHC